MTALSVNLNKIALLRNSREGNFPDLIAHAGACIEAGCQGITVHPRPDRRHIRPEDVRQLAALLRLHPGLEFNIEGNPFAEAETGYPGFIPLVLETRPQQCTLVPDTRGQLTSDHGFNLQQDGDRLAPIVNQLREAGVRVSLFMDPDPEQIELAARLGADRIELYTGPFAWAWADNPAQGELLFGRHQLAAQLAHQLGLGINAGHDLNLNNLRRYRQLPHLAEVSIGHALMVDALAMGLKPAVQAYLRVLSDGH